MNLETLSGLSSELVRLCDGVEKHGLVDYQMGVAEDEIVDSKSLPLILDDSLRDHMTDFSIK